MQGVKINGLILQRMYKTTKPSPIRYPDVRRSQLLRYSQVEPTVASIFRMRGALAGIPHPHQDGFLQVADPEGLLHLGDLEKAGNVIGGEAVSSVLWTRAAALSDPPGFVELLEAWHPNTPRAVLERFHMARIDYEELEACHRDFVELDVRKHGCLELDVFVDALQKKRAQLCGANVHQTPKSGAGDARVAELSARLTPFFFKADPCWQVGRHIRLTIGMFELMCEWCIKVSSRASPPRQLAFSDLMRYSFANVPCLVTKAYLTQKRVSQKPCTCDVCAFCRSNNLR